MEIRRGRVVGKERERMDWEEARRFFGEDGVTFVFIFKRVTLG